MSYPDEWNHVREVNLDKALDQLKQDKDEAIKNADYPAAAGIRDQMDDIRKRLAKGENEMKFKSHPYQPARWVEKTLVVQDVATTPTKLLMEAELVISTDGRVHKDRSGPLRNFRLLSVDADPAESAPHREYEVLGRHDIEKALSCLSGDLNYDNVGKAKQILKNLLK
ncbi:MAG: hypothetical protein ACXAC5_01200 [Promethearchaeota archaeon]